MSAPETDTPDVVEARPTVTLPSVEALMEEGVLIDAAEEAASAEAVAEPGPEADQRYRLPGIAVPPNVMLQSAVMRLVEQKDHLDALVKQGMLSPLLPEAWLGQHGGIDLRAFVASVVPFIPQAGRGEVAAARVPLKFLLGDTRRWGVADVAEPRSLTAYLASDERASSGSKDAAEVMMITPLGLCWAHEGRTRVGFLKQMGAASLAARVTGLPYPEPAQLGLYYGVVEGVNKVLCVLDKRRARLLAAPWLTAPLLTAYGVAAPQEWPATWPPLDRVTAQLATAQEVDLAKVVETLRREQADERWTGASLMQLGTWVPRWHFFLSTFIGLPVVLLLLGALALPGSVELAAVAAALGFAGGAIAALAVPWIHARRKHLN
jgi:hypothetical protein